MNYYKIKNTRAIEITFLGPTNYRGSRIKLTDNYTGKKVSKIFSYCYKTGNVLQQAINILQFNGANIVCRASNKDNYIINIENWGNEFININNLKNNNNE
jgi:hypothetical protein